MSKQNKQLIALVGLIVVAGIVAYFMVFRGDTPPPPPPADNTAPPTPAGPAPAAPATPGQPAPAPAGGAAAPVVSNEPLPMPKDEPLPVVTYSWKVAGKLGGLDHDRKDPKIEQPFDPMHVQNLDVVAPERQQYIARIKADWVIEGITITPQMIVKKNAKGEAELDENGKKIYVKENVKEAWFKNKRRPYKTGERLTGTRFTVEEIIQNRDKTAVKLRGDNQEELELELAVPGRYPD